MSVENIRDILKIIKEEDLVAEFDRFEEQLQTNLAPLRDKLDKQLKTQDVPSLEAHLNYVECWRNRVCRYFALCAAFVEHSKGRHFTLRPNDGENKPREIDRDAYRRTLTAGWEGLYQDMEQLIRSLDSRVMLAKKLLGLTEK